MNTLCVLFLLPVMCFCQTHHILFAEFNSLSFACANTGISQWETRGLPKNPALLAQHKQGLFSLQSRNYFFTKGLWQFISGIGGGLGKNTGGSIVIGRDGSSDFEQFLLQCNVGIQLGQKTAMGAGIHCVLNRSAVQSVQLELNGSWGLCTQITENLLFGCFVQNPGSFGIAQSYSLPFQARTGFNLRVHKGLELLAECHQRANESLAIAMGILYQPLLHLQLAIGFRTLGPAMSVGWKYRMKEHLFWSTGMEHQPQLGLSLSSGLEYRFSKS